MLPNSRPSVGIRRRPQPGSQDSPGAQEPTRVAFFPAPRDCPGYPAVVDAGCRPRGANWEASNSLGSTLMESRRGA